MSALMSGYFIDKPIRRLLHDPKKIVGSYVKPGMTVIDVGSNPVLVTASHRRERRGASSVPSRSPTSSTQVLPKTVCRGDFDLCTAPAGISNTVRSQEPFSGLSLPASRTTW
jgi:hypothetical protein